MAGVAADDFCYLTTTGRRSGRPHRIEIWYGGTPPTLYLMSGGRDRADWVRNLQADPAVLVELDGTTGHGTARLLDGDEAARARTLVFDKYAPRYDGDLVGWRERALPVAIDLG
jgi:deazaflavin-dependent oxidoreductase (nitroreductase family)